ncbi:MAG: 5-(carboxyamino)imidazole ribonucleotide synthase [Anaerolineales bacterium]
MKIGILGGGQLARMLALAGYPLGFTFRTLDPAPDAPAAPVSELICAGYADLDALPRFAEGVEVVTYEFENVPLESAAWLAERLPVYPPPAALRVAQERLTEKTFLRELGIPTPAFAPIDSPEDLAGALAITGLPAVLKTRRFGYDGKGQQVVHTTEEARAALNTFGAAALIAEAHIRFERELSLIGVRGISGEAAFYPLVENHHVGGILQQTIAPAPNLNPALQTAAEDFMQRIFTALNYVGVLAIEFFEVNTSLLANEIAPRVHNSGHWTIEGAGTSQFENHLRAICGLPLGSTAARGKTVMHNLIGNTPDFDAILRTPNAHLHWYGKQPRPGRKLGHVTLCAWDENQPL